MLKNTKSNKNSGFTIVELLIVIVVIAILAAITIVAYNGIQARARTTSGQALANSIQKKAEIYNTARSTGSGYPTYAELTATTSAVQEAQLDNPSAVLDGSTATNIDAGSDFNDGKKAGYKYVNSAGACVYYWQYDGTAAVKSIALGTASC